jgi:hypothetical protein
MEIVSIAIAAGHLGEWGMGAVSSRCDTFAQVESDVVILKVRDTVL